MIEIRWHGRGGQGAFTAAKLLGAAASLYQGKQAMAFPAFGPERRGAPVLAFTKIADQVIHDRTEIQKCDYIVILDETLFRPEYLADLKENGLLLLNSGEKAKYAAYPNLVCLDATGVAREILQRPITNTGMLGALAGLADEVSLAALCDAAGLFFKGSLLERNVRVMETMYALAQTGNGSKEDDHEKTGVLR